VEGRDDGAFVAAGGLAHDMDVRNGAQQLEQPA
jgi:hypothetical protein